MDIIKDILKYWITEIGKFMFYLVVGIILGLIFFYVRNPYGRYLDAWLE